MLYLYTEYVLFVHAPGCVNLPRYLFNKLLDGDSKLTEEALNDWSAFCELVLYLDVQDVCH